MSVRRTIGWWLGATLLTVACANRGRDGSGSATTSNEPGTSNGPGASNEAGAYQRMLALVEWPDLEAPPAVIGGGDKDAAVIVGIEGYDYVPAVPGALDNARAWHAYFIDGLGIPAHRVKLLPEREATKEKMLETLADAAAKAEAGGRVWFVFIGHGAPARPKDGVSADAFLLGADVRQTTDSIDARGLRHSEMLAALERSAAQPIAVLDACFSGRTGGGDPVVPGVQPTVVANLTAPKTAIVLTAAASDQYAGALPGRARPAFSYLLLGALRGWADDGDGKVTAAEALGYASKALGTLLTDRSQQPQLAGDADVVLARSGREQGPDLAEIARILAEGGKRFNRDGLVLTDLPTFELQNLTRDSLSEDVDLSQIDMEAERRREQQFEALELAKAKVDEARRAAADDPTGEKQAAAWCAVVDLPDPNPYRKDAQRACSDARKYVEQRRRLVLAMQRDWDEKVVPFMSLRSRTVDEKRRVMSAFVNAYGMLDDRDEVIEARRVLPGLEKGTLPSWQGAADAVHRAQRGYVFIAGGSFDGHDVAAFEMKRTEVTVDEYGQCVEAGKCSVPETGKYYNWGIAGRGDHPINGVTWQQAVEFCGFAGGRLPTEWEWEWAARGRDEGRTYPWGDRPKPSCKRVVMTEVMTESASWDAERWGCDTGATSPVGHKPKGNSRDGLSDMGGNVLEWTSSTDRVRVLRGGAWNLSSTSGFRASDRSDLSPGTDRFHNVGFRCAKTAGGSQ